MREAIGSTFVLNFIIVFFIIFIAMFATSTSYTKGAKVKNVIFELVEENADELSESDNIPGNVSAEIDSRLKAMGYRLNTNYINSKCASEYRGGILMNGQSNYRYCLYKHINKTKGCYFTVIAYRYFDLPIIGSRLEFPIEGSTRSYFHIVKYDEH